MKKLYSKELLIGLTVVIALLVLFFGIDYLKGVNVFKASNYYFASYHNVNGLAQSAPVTVNGFKVGLVRDISYEYDNPGNVKVELSLNRNLQLPEGTKAVLVTDMLGTSSIELQLGKSTRMHAIGDEITGVNSSGLMDNLSSEILPNIGVILPHIDSLVVSITALTTDPALISSISRLDAVMQNLQNSTARLSQVMNTMPSIANNAQQTMVNVNKFSSELADISRDLKEVSAKMSTMPIDSTMRHINTISANLAKVTDQLNSDQSSMGLLLRDPSLYNNLNNSAAHIDSILIDLKRQPKRYIPSIKIF